MKLVEFINPNPYAVQLVGPDRKTINVPKHAKVVLSDWYIARYTPRFLKVVRVLGESVSVPVQRATGNPHIQIRNSPTPVVSATPKMSVVPKAQPKPQRIAPKTQTSIKPQPRIENKPKLTRQTKGLVVGRVASGSPTSHFRQAIAEVYYPISNNIGVGILSYNRLPSLTRLIDSIRQNTDLKRTTIFVSDESSDPQVKNWLNSQHDIIVVDNPSRLGVAGNSNRLLRCLSRFKYKLLLNDDVQVLKPGWEKFYFDCMASTGMHHFCYRQTGVYGARADDATITNLNGFTLKTINDKPHGSIMAFDQKAFETVGYFDERFGTYGMEHVDWSRRIGMSGIQPPGYHDIAGSEGYFSISNDASAVEQRGEHLSHARQLYATLSQETKRIYVAPTDVSRVPTISYVIPCRNICERNESITTTIANIRAQRFPNIEIIIAEQDTTTRVDKNAVYPIKYVLSPSAAGVPFCKSAAFNLGVKNATAENVVLHDADILVPAGYTAEVFRILQTNTGCHIGKLVLYMSRSATSAINNQCVVDISKECERVVEYFEGGSLGVRKATYIAIGGFDETFVGYGVEDCEFFKRLEAYGNFHNMRAMNVVHLWHDRSGDWQASHTRNKTYMASIKNKPYSSRYQELNAAWAKKYSN